jgi:hypothetical protein
MNTDRIVALLRLGQLSLDLRAAELAVDNAKHAYYDAIHAHEEDFGYLEGRLDPENRNHAHAIRATKAEFDAYKAAKRAAYNVKRRWMSACRSAK